MIKKKFILIITLYIISSIFLGLCLYISYQNNEIPLFDSLSSDKIELINIELKE